MSAFKKLKMWLGWCPNAAMLNKQEEYIVLYDGKYIDKIKGMGFRGFLGILHLVFAVWLIVTALSVLARPPLFPWYVMELNILMSGILLAVGVSSLLIFFGLIKSSNTQRILALVNLALLSLFFLYLSLFLPSGEPDLPLLDRPYINYLFGFKALILFTLIAGMPSILTLLMKPAGEKRAGFIKAALLIFLVAFASLGAYYLYLNEQKDGMVTEEIVKNGKYRLYKVDTGDLDPRYFGLREAYTYFLDSTDSTTGHPISKDTYEAMKFLSTKEGNRVLAWWDYELEIKAAGKEPVITYASQEIRQTVGRPSSLYDKFDSHEKVVDVSRFFTTDSEDVAKSIAEKYGANIVYVSRQRMNDVMMPIMLSIASPDIYAQNQDVIKSPEDYLNKLIKPTMGYKFNSGAELEYFEKIFENNDVYIYQLKK